MSHDKTGEAALLEATVVWYSRGLARTRYSLLLLLLLLLRG